MDKKISIIIPAYNVGKYIERCIESVSNQTYKKIEIIIVNDGSTDDTLEIINRLKNNDSRIKVVNKKNGGLSSARNAGLKEVTGDYVMFLDSDDWIELNCCEKVIRKILEEDADLLFFDYFKEYDKKTVEFHAYKENMIYYKNEKKFFLYNMRTITAWGKLYKIDVIKNEFFDEKMKTAEDVDFNYRVYKNVRIAIYMNECLLHYRILEKSAIHGFDEKIDKKFEYPLEIIKRYANEEDLIKAYYSFAAIAYIVICQNKYFLNKEIGVIEKKKRIKNFSQNCWVKDLFKNYKKITIPYSRKILILLGKYRLFFSIIFIIKIKQEIEKK